MSYLMHCALMELNRRKWRTGATVIGYALAVGLMVVLAGILLASRTAANDILRSTTERN